MRAKDDRPLSTTIRRTALAAASLLGIVSTVVSCAGCLDNSQKSNTPAASVPSPDGSKDLKRSAMQALLDKALGDRDELVAKLREAGVKRSADLKGNSLAQQVVAELQRLTVEIDGLERSISVGTQFRHDCRRFRCCFFPVALWRLRCSRPIWDHNRRTFRNED